MQVQELVQEQEQEQVSLQMLEQAQERERACPRLTRLALSQLLLASFESQMLPVPWS